MVNELPSELSFYGTDFGSINSICPTTASQQDKVQKLIVYKPTDDEKVL